jgi:peptidyl-tRNA hydrolase
MSKPNNDIGEYVVSEFTEEQIKELKENIIPKAINLIKELVKKSRKDEQVK